MPTKFVTPEEWEELTGERGSWTIEMPPVKRKRRWPRWGRKEWHGELVAMPSFWETWNEEPDDK